MYQLQWPHILLRDHICTSSSWWLTVCGSLYTTLLQLSHLSCMLYTSLHAHSQIPLRYLILPSLFHPLLTHNFLVSLSSCILLTWPNHSSTLCTPLSDLLLLLPHLTATLSFLIQSTLVTSCIVLKHFISNNSAIFHTFVCRAHNLFPYSSVRILILSDIIIITPTDRALFFQTLFSASRTFALSLTLRFTWLP